MSFLDEKFSASEIRDNPWLEYVVRCKLLFKAYETDKAESTNKMKKVLNAYRERIADSVFNRIHPLRLLTDEMIDVFEHMLFLQEQQVDALKSTIDALIPVLKLSYQKKKVLDEKIATDVLVRNLSNTEESTSNYGLDNIDFSQAERVYERIQSDDDKEGDDKNGER